MKNKFVSAFLAKYISFVYRTSKVTFSGSKEFIDNDQSESYIALFWHGDSFSLYPALKGVNLYVITTINRRGDYISEICHYFKYRVLRLPDESKGENDIFKISKELKENRDYHVALVMDGPLGPYHEPKDLIFVLAILTKRKILPVSIKTSRNIVLSRRWDKFKIPLPYGKITINFQEPIIVKKEDRQDHFSKLKNALKESMV